MKTLWCVTMVLAMTLAGGGSALAQACKPLPVERSSLKVDPLRLYDMSGQPKDWAAKASLPPTLNATDCGDRNYVMLTIAKANYLVRKSDLSMPEIIECRCPTEKRSVTPGAPGLGDPKFCPAKQCLGQ